MRTKIFTQMQAKPKKNSDSSSEPMQDTMRQGCEDSPILCGIKPILELLESEPQRFDALWLRHGLHSAESQKIFDLCRSAHVHFTLTDESALTRFVGAGVHHQGVVARLFPTGFADFASLLETGKNAPLPLLVALDQVQDPGNAGTIVRTLHALGGAGLIIPRHNSVFLGAGARRSAAGALEHLPVCKVSNLSQALVEANEAEWHTYGAVAESGGGVNVFTQHLLLPALLVLGSEEKGLRPLVKSKCATLLSIPMLRSFDSLNVAQAGAILMSCFARLIANS